MRLPSGGLLMGFCKLRSSCPPAPRTRASHHDPWSSHDTFCNFWAFGRSLVFARSEEARSENNRDLGQNRRQQGACTCTWYNARWMVVLFDWVKYSFLSIYSLWVTVPQVLHSRHEMLVVIITIEHEDYKHQASETPRASQKRRVHLVKWPLTEEFFTNPADKGYFIMNQM